MRDFFFGQKNHCFLYCVNIFINALKLNNFVTVVKERS
jgi:hypothetical protein